MLINVPLAHIFDNPYQRRQDYGDIESLAADIMARGLLQVPRGRLLFDGRLVSSEKLRQTLAAVNGWPGGESFTVDLAFGHRRLRAYRLMEADAGEAMTMPVYIEALTDDQMLDAVWSENQHRTDINPIEQAELLAAKLERARAAGGNQQTVAAEWGLDRSTVANKVRLLELPADVQTALRERKLSERQALALLPIVEMEAKLNGAAVEWSESGNVYQWGQPVAPAAFMRHVAAKPDETTSDAIREYARRVLDHAGHPLPDAIATFDSTFDGQGDDDEPIVQTFCAGCRYRHNQHCLNVPCLDAKWDLFQTQIPRLAADHTGLPWSDVDAHFTNDRDAAQHLRHLYGSGQREGLVIGWVPNGWRSDRLDDAQGYHSPQATMADWRKGLLIGRLPRPADDPSAELPPQPPVAAWRSMRYDANQTRKARIRRLVVDTVAPLADNAAFRPLLAVAGVESVADLVEFVWQRAYLYDHDIADKLRAAGLDPALADQPDPGDRLHELAVIALADWYDFRGSFSSARTAAAAVALGQALDAFEQAGITEDSDETDLADLLRWLKLARADAVAVVNGGKPA